MPVVNGSQTTAFSLGITGGIGSGKSTIAKLFAGHGAGVIDLDEIAHALTAPGGRAMAIIRETFGDEFVSENGALDRAKMRELVFQDPSARKRLENILHPMIHQEALDQAHRLKNDYVIFVIPLLVEQPIWQDMARRILLVDCPETLQVRRVMARSGMSKEQVEAIMAAQATREARRAIADDVILNDHDDGVESLLGEVARLDAEYKKMAKKMISENI
ncbi:dephospho-CoA kinase [Oxalobacter sp. OttesenSCG-928-P03]|nr:dephospho-CoA kinase [Oxalobacter sp. OttesenSCG-928-P03]